MEMIWRNRRRFQDNQDRKREGQGNSVIPVMPFPSVFPLNFMLSPITPLVYSGYPPISFSASSMPQNPFFSAEPCQSRITHQRYQKTKRNQAISKLSPEVIVIDSDDQNPSNSSTFEPTSQHQILLTETPNKIEEEQSKVSSSSQARKKQQRRKKRYCKEPIFCQQLKNRKDRGRESIECSNTKPIRKIKKKQFKDHLEQKNSKLTNRRDRKDILLKKQTSSIDEKQESSNGSSTILKSKTNRTQGKILQEKKQKYENQIDEEQHQREISKFLDSNGEIRIGKEFQSQIPYLKGFRTESFRIWMEQKRQNMLKSEINFFFSS